MNNRLINTKVAGGGGGCTDIVDNYDPFGGNGVALYQLNGNALDSSPNAYNGVDSNVTWGGAGVFGTSAAFNGSTSKVVLPTPSIIPTNLNFSLSIWIKGNSISSADDNVVYLNFNGSYFNMAVLSNNVRAGYSNSSNQGYSIITTSAPLDASAWNHVVISSTGLSGNCSIYVNGSFEISGALQSTTRTITVTDGNALGNIQGVTAYPFNGSIDQVRIFNTALTPLEVEALYTEELCICDGTVDTLDILGDGSCIATYQLDGNANDLSGNYSGTPTDVSYGVGEFDLAGVFNGSNSYVDLPNLGITGSQARTVSLWVKLNSIPPSSVDQLYSQGTNNNNEAFNIQTTTAGKIQVSYAGKEINSSTTLSLNTWYNVIVIYKGGAIETLSNTDIYINGNQETVVDGGGAATGIANTINSDYSLGYRRNISTLFYDGSIDQVRIFNKALNSTEVTTLYNETACTVTYSNTEWGGAWDTVNSITSACSGGSSTLSFSNSNRTATESGFGFYVGAFSENVYNTFYLFGADAGGLTTKFTGNFTDDTFIYRPILEEGYYAEILMEAPDCVFGLTKNRVCPAGDQSAWYDNAIQYRNWTGQILRYNTVVATTATYTVGDIIGVLLDDVAQTVTFYKNGAFIYTVNL